MGNQKGWTFPPRVWKTILAAGLVMTVTLSLMLFSEPETERRRLPDTVRRSPPRKGKFQQAVQKAVAENRQRSSQWGKNVVAQVKQKAKAKAKAFSEELKRKAEAARKRRKAKAEQL